MGTISNEFFWNIDAPPLFVAHADLKRIGNDEDMFRRQCPICLEGILVGRRDPHTFQLLIIDNCLLCGQQVIYTDL